MLDLVLGEPPPHWHPVVWMGSLLGRLERRAPAAPAARVLFGGVAGLALPCAWASLALVAQRWAPWPLQAVLLKPTFAGRALLAAATRVEQALVAGELSTARARLACLVSRPTANLDSSLVAAAAVESLAENLVDSWLAPLLAYATCGLAGAYAYRAANTADAMWGYRTPAYEWLGKPAARLDDLLNWLPARLTALLLVAAGPRPLIAFRVWRRDADTTASPNAGQPMAAAAGQLGVRLDKSGHYTLNADAAPPCATDVAAARRLTARAMLLSAGLALALRRLRHA